MAEEVKGKHEVDDADLLANPDKAKETIFIASYLNLQSRKKQVGAIIDLLHNNVQALLDNDNPRARMAIAELVNSYAMMQNVALAIEKQLIDTTHKEVDLRDKLDTGDDKLDPFKMQKLMQDLKKKMPGIENMFGKSDEPALPETTDKVPEERTKS